MLGNVINSCDGLSCLFNLPGNNWPRLCVTCRQHKLWIQQRDSFDEWRRCFLLHNNSFCLQKSIDFFWGGFTKHSCLMIKTQREQTLKLTNRRRWTETKPIWNTCLIYTCVNRNSNGLLQSMKQAVMNNKQSIIGEWDFITIYGRNCSHS